MYIGSNLYEYGTWAPVTQLPGISPRAYSVFSYDNEIIVGDYNDLKIFDKNSKLLFTKLEGIIGAHDIYADADYIYAAAVNKLYIINRGTIPTPSPTPYGYKTPTPTPSVTPTPDLPVTR